MAVLQWVLKYETSEIIRDKRLDLRLSNAFVWGRAFGQNDGASFVAEENRANVNSKSTWEQGRVISNIYSVLPCGYKASPYALFATAQYHLHSFNILKHFLAIDTSYIHILSTDLPTYRHTDKSYFLDVILYLYL